MFTNILARPYLLLVLAPVFWGGNIVAGKLAIGHVDPNVLVIGRWAGAILVLLTLSRPHLREDWPQIRPALPLLFLFGALGFTGFNLLLYNAVLYTSGVNASIEQASIPVLVLLGNFVLFAVRPRPLQIAGLIITIIGVVWVATHGEPMRVLALSINIGDLMVLLACILYAAYSLTLKFRPSIHWLSFLSVTAFFALATAVLFQALVGGGMDRFFSLLPRVTLRGWLIVLYVMIFPSILAQLFYARGVEIVGPNRASIFINLLPVFGTILSVIILGERFEAYHAIAAILVIGGITMAEYSVRKT
ncbi:MAG TPA: DMT family transporter [Devosia sp.]|nr:DMT family transporter [Devosia sp.]